MNSRREHQRPMAQASLLAGQVRTRLLFDPGSTALPPEDDVLGWHRNYRARNFMRNQMKRAATRYCSTTRRRILRRSPARPRSARSLCRPHGLGPEERPLRSQGVAGQSGLAKWSIFAWTRFFRIDRDRPPAKTADLERHGALAHRIAALGATRDRAAIRDHRGARACGARRCRRRPCTIAKGHPPNGETAATQRGR